MAHPIDVRVSCSNNKKHLDIKRKMPDKKKRKGFVVLTLHVWMHAMVARRTMRNAAVHVR